MLKKKPGLRNVSDLLKSSQTPRQAAQANISFDVQSSVYTYLSGQPRGQGHFQVALEAQQRGDEDEELVQVVEDGPVLDNVEDHAGGHHAEPGHQEGEEHFDGDGEHGLFLGGDCRPLLATLLQQLLAVLKIMSLFSMLTSHHRVRKFVVHTYLI